MAAGRRFLDGNRSRWVRPTRNFILGRLGGQSGVVHPGELEKHAFAGDVSKAKIYFDIAVRLDEDSIGHDECENDQEYWEENTKNDHVYWGLTLVDGRKRKSIDFGDAVKRFGIPVEMRVAAVAADPNVVTFLVPHWAQEYSQPCLLEHRVVGIFSHNSKNFVVTSSHQGENEIFHLDGDLLKYDVELLHAHLKTKNGVTSFKHEKTTIALKTDKADIDFLLRGRKILDFDNRTQSIHINGLLAQLSGSPGFVMFGSRPKTTEPLKLFDHALVKDAPVVPYNKPLNFCFRKQGITNPFKTPAIEKASDMFSSIFNKQQIIADGAKLKTPFLRRHLNRGTNRTVPPPVRSVAPTLEVLVATTPFEIAKTTGKKIGKKKI